MAASGSEGLEGSESESEGLVRVWEVLEWESLLALRLRALMAGNLFFGLSLSKWFSVFWTCFIVLKLK